MKKLQLFWAWFKLNAVVQKNYWWCLDRQWPAVNKTIQVLLRLNKCGVLCTPKSGKFFESPAKSLKWSLIQCLGCLESVPTPSSVHLCFSHDVVRISYWDQKQCWSTWEHQRSYMLLWHFWKALWTHLNLYVYYNCLVPLLPAIETMQFRTFFATTSSKSSNCCLPLWCSYTWTTLSHILMVLSVIPRRKDSRGIRYTPLN